MNWSRLRLPRPGECNWVLFDLPVRLTNWPSRINIVRQRASGNSQVASIIQIEVANVATLLDAARKVCLGFGRTAYWFRGHARADWSLVPSVHRDYSSVGERNLMGRFLMSAPTRHSRCPEIRDGAPWLCLMQHFGLPTRLLDWTGSLLASVYFAVSYDPMPGPAAVWVLVPSELNKASSHKSDSTFLIHGPEAMPLVKGAFDGGLESDDVLAVLGQDVDLRMTVQQGAFTIHGDATPLEQRSGAERFLAQFVIPENAKPTFDDELWVLGMRRSALFPDLGNLAKDLANDRRLIPKRSRASPPVTY